VERLAGVAGLNAGAARHRGGIKGLTAERPAGIGRLAPQPVVRRIGIDEGACGWQVYCL